MRLGEARQRAAEAAALEQLVGAERAGGDDDAAGGQRRWRSLRNHAPERSLVTA